MSKPTHLSHTLPTRLYLGAACFLSGAAMMVIEICAFRLLAPLFGNSVYTWTALIGVILIAFSAGGFLGGRLSDKYNSISLLGWLLAGASVLTVLIPPLHLGFGESFTTSGLIGGSVMVSLFLFALPGALLGAVSPAAVRFYSMTFKESHVGAAAGTVSMLGSLGSFVGTFLSGFVLLSHFGVRSIFIGCGVLLLVLAVLAFVLARNGLKKSGTIAAVGGIAAVLGAMAHDQPGKEVIFTHESFYHRLEISETGNRPYRQRLLKLDSTPEGAMNPDSGDLVMDYQHYWRLPLLKDNARLESALFIGAGAFGMPEEMSREFPLARVDVAEIDPQVIEAGRKFFKLSEHPRVQAHAGDARHFLRTRKNQHWDLIFGDAYAGVRSIPSHLVTKEFFQLVSDHLTPQGIFVMNAISAVQGERAELLSGLLATLKTVFPHVEAFAVQGPRQLTQNIIILASLQDWKPWITDRFYTAGTWQNHILNSHVAANQLPQQGQVFTDDFNPVDRIIARGLLAE
jgi:spermidine synthase